MVDVWLSFLRAVFLEIFWNMQTDVQTCIQTCSFYNIEHKKKGLSGTANIKICILIEGCKVQLK